MKKSKWNGMLLVAAWMLCFVACGTQSKDAKEIACPQESEMKTEEAAVDSTTAPSAAEVTWDQRIALGDEIREKREKVSGLGNYWDYVPGKYIDMYETSEGVVVLEQDGTLWRIKVQPEQQDHAMEKICNLLDDSSEEEAWYASYVNAHQIGDDLYFSKNTKLYCCHLTDGVITECYDLKDDVVVSGLVVLGGTADSVLLSDRESFASFVWETKIQQLRQIQWTDTQDAGQAGSVSQHLPSCGACIGYENNEIFFVLNGCELYAADISTRNIRRLTAFGAWETKAWGYIYSNYAKIQEDHLYFLCTNRAKDTQGNDVKYDMLCWIPTEGTDSTEMIESYSPELSYYETILDDLHGSTAENIQTFYFSENQCYILQTHLGPKYEADEQGSILYTLDNATGEVCQVSDLLEGMNIPAQMIVRDQWLYVISSDGREADVVYLGGE